MSDGDMGEGGPAAERWLVTGASGRVGRALRERLRRPGRTLRLLDVVPPEPGVDADVEVVTASLTDEAAVRDACSGVDAIVHLGGQSGEQPWAQILADNVDGTRCLFEAARVHGVRRVLLASSSHAVGCWSRRDAGPDGLPADVPARPDTYYGWSKVAMESLAQLYAERYPMTVTCVRIGTVLARPTSRRALATWLSYDDAARLVEAALVSPAPGVRYVWGISRNTRRWWSLGEGEQLGYHPVDDAEAFAEEVLERVGDGAGVEEAATDRAGADWVERPLGVSMS